METDKIRIITGVPGDEEKEKKRGVEIEEEPERDVVKRTGLRTAWVVYCYLLKYYNMRTAFLTLCIIMGIYEGIKGNGAGDKFVFWFVFGVIMVVAMTIFVPIWCFFSYDYKKEREAQKRSQIDIFEYINRYYEKKNEVN